MLTSQKLVCVTALTALAAWCAISPPIGRAAAPIATADEIQSQIGSLPQEP